MVYYKLKTISNRYVPNKGRYLRRGKRPFAGSVLFPLLNLSRRSPKGEDGKPFTGIYLFAPQKDKCHSNFEKILNAQVYLSFLSAYPHWEQSQKNNRKQHCVLFCNAFSGQLLSLLQLRIQLAVIPAGRTLPVVSGIVISRLSTMPLPKTDSSSRSSPSGVNPGE